MNGLDTITKPLTYPEKAANYVIPKLIAIQSRIQNGIAAKTGLPIQEEPTGNLTRDVLANTPRIIGEIGEKVVPPMISRGSILTAGLMKGVGMAAPALKAMVGATAKGAEALSGLEYKTPGILMQAFEDPTLRTAAAKSTAGPLYEAAKNELPMMAKEAAGLSPIDGVLENKNILAKAQELMASGESLEPAEALEVRKAADALKGSKSINQNALIKIRNWADNIAKESENIKMADPIYARGVKSQALNNLLPQNKLGGSSIAKTILGSLKGVGTVGLMSPKVQGLAFTGAGKVARAVTPMLANPVIPAATAALIQKFLKAAGGNKEKALRMAQEKGYLIPKGQQ